MLKYLHILVLIVNITWQIFLLIKYLNLNITRDGEHIYITVCLDFKLCFFTSLILVCHTSLCSGLPTEIGGVIVVPSSKDTLELLGPSWVVSIDKYLK